MTTSEEIKIPEVLSCRSTGFENALRRWMLKNKRVPVTKLLHNALKKELAPFAGKRDEIFQETQKNFPKPSGVKPSNQVGQDPN